MRHQALNLATVEDTRDTVATDTEVTRVTTNDGRPQDGDLLLTEIARVRSESRRIANEVRSRHDRLLDDHGATKRLVSRSRADIGDLIATTKTHSDTLEHHRRGLIDHAVHLVEYKKQIEDLRIDLDTIELTSVDQTAHDRLQDRVQRLERQRGIRNRARTRHQTSNHALWAFYCAAALVAGGFLSFLIENHNVIF